jgi:hypothetical protein
MSSVTPIATRDYRDWSLAAVRLLQGVVYSDDAAVWDVLLRSRSSLEGYFVRLGLALVVDEAEGYAFLRQMADDELPPGYEGLPKLIRKVALGYGPTVLAVLLRDELRRFEDEDLHNERCVVEADALFERWKLFTPATHDDVRHRKDFNAALAKLEELGFVRPFGGDEANAWEVRRVLKARLAVAELEQLKAQLAAAAGERARGAAPHTGANHE